MKKLLLIAVFVFPLIAEAQPWSRYRAVHAANSYLVEIDRFINFCQVRRLPYLEQDARNLRATVETDIIGRLRSNWVRWEVQYNLRYIQEWEQSVWSTIAAWERENSSEIIRAFLYTQNAKIQLMESLRH